MAERDRAEFAGIGDCNRPSSRRDRGPFDASVSRDVCGHPVFLVDSTAAENEGVEVQSFECHLGQIARDDELSWTDVATGGDEVDPLVVGKVDERPQSEWKKGDRPSSQCVCHLGGGSPRVECHRLAVGDEIRYRPSDALFGLCSLEDPNRVRHLVSSKADADGSTVHPVQHPISGERIQVPSDRHLGAAELDRQLPYRDLVSASDGLRHCLSARSHIHGVKFTRIIVNYGPRWSRWRPQREGCEDRGVTYNGLSRRILHLALLCEACGIEEGPRCHARTSRDTGVVRATCGSGRRYSAGASRPTWIHRAKDRPPETG